MGEPHDLLLVFGLLFGAMLVEWASYHWVFWFAAIVALPVATACVLSYRHRLQRPQTGLSLEHRSGKILI
jgi:membrane protein implicated in regulation of membrane protease activity